MRRPLAAAALLFVAAVRMITLLRPLPVPEPDREDGQWAVYTGTVSDIVSYTDTQSGNPVRLVYLEDAASETGSASQNTNFNSSFQIICRLTESSYLPGIGSRIRCEGEVSHFREATNPGEFNAKEYYNRQGIAFELRDAAVTGSSQNDSLYRQTLWRLKTHMGMALEALLSPEDASVMKAMLLGDKKGMDREIKSLYQAAGISHVVAISGLHISILGTGVYNLLSALFDRLQAARQKFPPEKRGRPSSGKVSSGKIPACAVSAFFLLSFLFMTGFSASSMRAGIMFALSLTARLLGRTYDTATALSVAAALLLVENPAWIDDTGFQLSFTAAFAASSAVPAFSDMDNLKDWLLKRKNGGNIRMIVDSTFASPYLQNALDLGADLVVHSATKYLSGHGFGTAGVIAGPKELIDKCRMPYLQCLGAVIDPFDAWLIMQGMKTLGVRMERHCQNAMAVAEHLEKHPKVDRVYYPGLKSHPTHDIAVKQMHGGFGGMMSVDIKGVEGEVRYQWGDYLQAIANCSYQDARDKDRLKDDGKPSISYNNRVPNRPWLFGNAELDIIIPDLFMKESKLRIGYDYQYVHWFFLTWEGYGSLASKSRIPTQHLQNARLAYSWKGERYTLSLECNNLFDRLVYDNYMLQKPGRSFICKFRFFIN